MAIDTVTCALDILAATPTGGRAIVAALSPALHSQRPTADEWSVQEVPAHLLHVETVVIRPRIEQMLAEDDPLLAAAQPPTPARGQGDAGGHECIHPTPDIPMYHQRRKNHEQSQ